MILAVRLREKQDADLIRWLQAIEPGERSRVVRETLRASLQATDLAWPPGRPPKWPAPLRVKLDDKPAAEESVDLDDALDRALKGF